MRHGVLALLLLAAGCAPPADPPPSPEPPPLTFPDPTDLPFQPDPPPLLTRWSTGVEIADAGAWAEARAEIQALFAHYVTGPAPTQALAGQTTLVAADDLVEVSLDAGLDATVALFLPSGPGPHPVLLGLNKCGNHTVSIDPRLTVTDAWVPSDCPTDRGGRATSWPVEAVTAAGWAVATIHQNAIVPDSRTEADDALATLGAGGAVIAWAWGLSRVLDALSGLDGVDASRVVPVGHSRRGKAALWAAALDERFAATIPHQSGTAGVTMSRSHGGESVASLTTIFPHWFAPRFAEFGGNEGALPIDQHHLLALVAPRPLLATDGEDDSWADPPGAAWSVELATPAWELLGASSRPVQILRPGDHSLDASDWAIWLDWLADEGI